MGNNFKKFDRPIRRIILAEVTPECRACLRPLRRRPLASAATTNLTALSCSTRRPIRRVTEFFRRRLLRQRRRPPQPPTAPSNPSRGLQCLITVTATILTIRTLTIRAIRWLWRPTPTCRRVITIRPSMRLPTPPATPTPTCHQVKNSHPTIPVHLITSNPKTIHLGDSKEGK